MATEKNAATTGYATKKRSHAVQARPTWDLSNTRDLMSDPRVETRTTVCYHARPESGQHQSCPGLVPTREAPTATGPSHYAPCECPCHSEPHWHDRHALKQELTQLKAIQSRLETNRLADEYLQRRLQNAIERIEDRVKEAEEPRYYIEEDCVIDRYNDTLLYEGVYSTLNFSRLEARALLELLNEGKDNLSWEESGALVEARVAEYAAKAPEGKVTP